MPRHFRNILFLLLPFTIMIVVNEMIRPTIKERPYSYHGIKAINSSDKILDKCTWICHNQTSYCKAHHVKMNRLCFKFTDRIYFGVIMLLASTRSYWSANIVFLVLIFPMFIWYLLIKSLNLQDEINKLRKRK